MITGHLQDFKNTLISCTKIHFDLIFALTIQNRRITLLVLLRMKSDSLDWKTNLVDKTKVFRKNKVCESFFFHSAILNSSCASDCCVWFKHILLVNTKGSGVAKLRHKPSPTLLCLFFLCKNEVLEILGGILRYKTSGEQ